MKFMCLLLNIYQLDRKTFYSDREVAFLKASAPNANSTLAWISM